jgi:hypothetical protein
VLILATQLFLSTGVHARDTQTVSQDESCSNSYLVFVLKIYASNRSIHVLKATQVSGTLVQRQGPSSKTIYEITKDNQSLAIGFLPEDPLVTRGFPSQSHPMENMGRGESATILVDAPFADLKDARDGRLGIRLYTLRTGVRLSSLNADELKALVAAGKVELQFKLSRSELASQIQRLSQR